MRRCLDCQMLTNHGSRCKRCSTERKRIRNADRATARAVIAASPVCANCGSTQDLTADHIVPLARGGSNEGRRQTLCRSCNARKRDR